MSARLRGSGVDRQAALARVGGDIDLLREIAGLFLEECPRALAEIRDCVQQRDAPQLEQAAHSLKGSVANFGAQAAVDAAFRLEQMGRAGQLDDAAQVLDVLESALHVVCAELMTL